MRATPSSTSSRISWRSPRAGRPAHGRVAPACADDRLAAATPCSPAVPNRAAQRRRNGRQVARQLARVAPGSARTNRRPVAQRLQARLLLGRVLGREQRAPAACPAARSARRRTTSGARACPRRRRRCGAARQSAAIRSRASGGTCGDSLAAVEARDEVELAPARDLDHAREVDLAQLDRRARERAHHGGGVLRIDEQAHPCEHVAHLRAAQEATSRGAPAPRSAAGSGTARRRARTKDTSVRGCGPRSPPPQRRASGPASGARRQRRQAYER